VSPSLTFRLDDALDSEPFSGDDTRVSVLNDRVVRFRKTPPCAVGSCGRARTERDLDDGRIGTFRWCTECTAAQAIEAVDGFLASETWLVIGTDPLDGDAARDWLAGQIDDNADDPEEADLVAAYRWMLAVVDDYRARFGVEVPR
jgi:hypothetical protein